MQFKVGEMSRKERLALPLVLTRDKLARGRKAIAGKPSLSDQDYEFLDAIDETIRALEGRISIISRSEE